jgi:TolA-binding protein
MGRLNSAGLWLAFVAWWAALCALPVSAQDTAPAAGTAPNETVAAPPPFNRWFSQTRWDEAYAVERSAGYDRLKVADAIEAWKMYLNLFPQAGMANEAAWHITNLTTRYGDTSKTIAAYERYIKDFPDGDYAADALWSLTYQYMRIPDWDAVYAKYDEFLQRFPKSPYGDEALNGLAGRAAKLKNDDLALNLYNQLLQRYPTSDYCDDAVSAIGGIYAKREDVEHATQAFFHLANQYPYSSLVEPGIEQLVVLYYRTGDAMAAIELGKKFLAAFPQSSYTKYVQMYMYYAAVRARVSVPGIEMPDFYNENDLDKFEVFRKEHDEAYQAAASAMTVQNYAEAVRLYSDFLARFPSSDKTDDALYAIGQAYDALETYATAAEKATTPEQLGQVAGDWQHVTQGFQEAVPGGEHPVQSAIDAYIILSQSMPGSDYRDNALYLVGQDYEKLNDWVSACKAYLDLITTYPVGSYSNSAVSRLDQLYTKLPLNADRAVVMTTVMNTYPHHSLADDYLYKLAVQALLDGDVKSARDLFARYGADYPHRSFAADAVFWQARCEQLLGAGVTARVLYGRLATDFLQSGLADDGYVEYVYIAEGEDAKVLQAGVDALNRAATAVGKPLVGYDAIARDHVLLMVPSDKVIDVRAYNLPDHLEEAYGRLAQFCGGVPADGARVELVVDDTVNVLTPGNPVRVPASFIGPPPAWRQWFEALALSFVNDPAIAPVTNAIPGIAPGAARFVALQLEDTLYSELGEMNVGAANLQNHLRDLNTTKNAAAAALNQYAQSKSTAEKIDANVGLGMLWNLADRYAEVPGELIDSTALAGLFPAARKIPPEVAKQAESLEQKAALAAYWINSGLGKDLTGVLKTWGFPLTAEELAKVKAAVEAAQKPAAPAAGEAPKQG